MNGWCGWGGLIQRHRVFICHLLIIIIWIAFSVHLLLCRFLLVRVTDAPCFEQNVFATCVCEGLGGGRAGLILLLLLLDAHHQFVVAVFLSSLEVLVIVFRELVGQVGIVHQFHEVWGFWGRFLSWQLVCLRDGLLFQLLFKGFLSVKFLFCNVTWHKGNSPKDWIEITSLGINWVDLRLIFEKIGLTVEPCLLTFQKLIFLLVLDRDARCRHNWWQYRWSFSRKLSWNLLWWWCNHSGQISCLNCNDLLFFTLIETVLSIKVLLIVVIILIVLHHWVTVLRLAPELLAFDTS